ncbi:FecR domain-containing protein [Verrucomicrobiaceae bacterium R5-34]|uniref:FecR domain-containing protein n=1 Tax=Oceaniferula flava TaxID=2800421 RepID=A0AAE2SA51_9BACT|nr:FecR family protein [Oceaniferula flavus]MBK1831525.1 FecR domain-containing protein [Verrucomicrobiaceae bacterium R5-34]MBK1854236.1 FecR domain-containing protein [Oceaniferula flavus]MBM1135542.1 FecR domain-containing protein [Oceaniferula flavus]
MSRISLITTLSAASLLLGPSLQADNLQSAKVTTRVNDVRLHQPNSSRQAKVGDTVRGHTSVQTGRRSRAELTFQDRTVTRLGANSAFTFRQGSRDINLNQGSILLQVPKSAGGATIRTATVTAAITGTTLLMEYNRDKWVKLITLEGTVSLNLGKQKGKGGLFRRAQKVKVPAGQMIVMRPDGTIITRPVDVDLKRLLESSLLAGNQVFGPLSPEARRHIALAVEAQEKLKRKGILVSENQVNRHPGSRVIADRNDLRDILDKPDPYEYETDYPDDYPGDTTGGNGTPPDVTP